KEIARDATNGWDAMNRIGWWVYRNVRDKGLDKGFASAKQTLDSRSGDCTEHTMLAVALTRAVGIPARICAGVVWQKDAFYYHFWYEAFIGEWVAMDPTLGQFPADARRIQLTGERFESDTALEFGEGILKTLNRLELRSVQE
ncbi:MAG: transglutaminase-like domain-containing protein, partial [Candidatus Poribacteria bacterium]|nr:transglutaminase-like domain-containing protein [Candidatus Poribacteria bacterium]